MPPAVFEGPLAVKLKGRSWMSALFLHRPQAGGQGGRRFLWHQTHQRSAAIAVPASSQRFDQSRLRRRCRRKMTKAAAVTIALDAGSGTAVTSDVIEYTPPVLPVAVPEMR